MLLHAKCDAVGQRDVDVNVGKGPKEFQHDRQYVTAPEHHWRA